MTAKGGASYCADHIAICIREDRYCLSFVSSGRMTILPADRIAAIEYSETGRNWCNSCDGPITTWRMGEPPEWAVPYTPEPVAAE